MTGSLSILNTGAGDIVVTFEDHDDAEVEKAIAMLEDMQKRGYAIMVRLDDGTYTRATAIDRATKSYIVRPPDAERKPRGRRKGAKVAVRGRTAVASARSAGGCAARSPFTLLAAAR